MLPDNLRVFDMELVITEIRSFHRPASLVGNTNDGTAEEFDSLKNPFKPSPLGNINIPGLAERTIQNSVNAMIPNSQWASALSNNLLGLLQRDPGNFSKFPIVMRNFDEMATFMKFRFSKCEFDMFAEAPTYFGTLSKTPDTVATNKIVIKTPIIRERNSYGLLGAILEDTPGLLQRNPQSIAKYFFKRTGKDSLESLFPPEERGYLDGVKKEFFEASRANQAKKQDALEKENIRLGGILGGLLQSALQVGSSALNDLVSGALANVLLGNVYSNFFGPSIAQNIATKVSLDAPDVLQAALTKVVLDSNGAVAFQTPDPNNADLQAAPIQDPTTSPVIFVAPQINPGTTQVQLDAAQISGITDPQVQLDAPQITAQSPQAALLTGPQIGPPLATRVNLVEAPPLGAPPTTVVLEEAPQGVGNLLPVSQDSAPLSTQQPDFVPLEAPPVGQATSTSINLDEPPTGNLTTTQIDFESAPVKDGVPGSVRFVEPVIGPGTKTVDLEGAEPKGGQVTAIRLEGAPVSTTVPDPVKLDEPPVNPGQPGDVAFEGPAISTRAQGKLPTIDFEAPPVDNRPPSGIELTTPPTKPVGVREVDFESAPVNKDIPPAITLEAPEINKEKPGTVRLEDPNGEGGFAGDTAKKGSLEAPSGAKVNLEAPPVNKDATQIGNIFTDSEENP
jgi:hypothetical protein